MGIALIKKIYENDDDFDKAVKDAKPTEIFYKLAEQADQTNPKTVYYIITLSAIVGQDEKTIEQGFRQIISVRPQIADEKAFEIERLRVKKIIDDLIIALQKEHSTYANIISGTQIIEV